MLAMLGKKLSGDEDKIERLDARLNSRTKYHPPEDLREPIAPIDEETVPEGFKSPDIDTLIMSDRRAGEPYPLIKKIFLVALLFCVCASIAAVLIYFKGDNFISTKNLDITVEGPVNISAGSPVELAVTITNKNNAPLDSVNMSIIYPDGTRSADNPDQQLSNVKETLTQLSAGDKLTKNEKAIFLGAEGDVKQIHISVDYKVHGSNATFTKEKDFSLTIGSAPVTVTLSRPDNVNSGELFQSTVTVAANSDEILRNVILKAEYPYGWNLQSVSPQSTDKDGTVWLLGDLSPGDKKTITIRGSLLGENNDQRSFRFLVGSGTGGDKTIDTLLASDSMAVSINRPDIDLGLSLNNESASDYVAPAGKQISGVITFKNNLPENLTNPQIQLKLSGGALDRSSVSAVGGGFYDSANNQIIWNSTNFQNLITLAPGDSGSVNFNLSSLQNLPIGSANQEIDLTVTLSGRPQDATSDVKVSETGTVKIGSQVNLTAKSLYSLGPFTNAGPIPPKAENSTTYTVSLALSNTRNDIQNVKITGTLGANVDWAEEATSSDGTNFSYDSSNRTISWDVGTLASGAGFSTPGESASFKVSLVPSLGQVGGTPVLLSNITLTGMDEFTNTPLRTTIPDVTTAITSDPSYVQGDETVVK